MASQEDGVEAAGWLDVIDIASRAANQTWVLDATNGGTEDRGRHFDECILAVNGQSRRFNAQAPSGEHLARRSYAARPARVVAAAGYDGMGGAHAQRDGSGCRRGTAGLGRRLRTSAGGLAAVRWLGQPRRRGRLPGCVATARRGGGAKWAGGAAIREGDTRPPRRGSPAGAGRPRIPVRAIDGNLLMSGCDDGRRRSGADRRGSGRPAAAGAGPPDEPRSGSGLDLGPVDDRTAGRLRCRPERGGRQARWLSLASVRAEILLFQHGLRGR